MEEQPARDTEGSGDHWSRLSFRIDRQGRWIGPVGPAAIPFAGGTLWVLVVLRAPGSPGVVIMVDAVPLVQSENGAKADRLRIPRPGLGWTSHCRSCAPPSRLWLSAELSDPYATDVWPECRVELRRTADGEDNPFVPEAPRLSS